MVTKLQLNKREKIMLKYIKNPKHMRLPSYTTLMRISGYKSKASISYTLEKFRKNKLI